MKAEPATCKHKRSSVKDSRPSDYARQDGSLRFKDINYPFFISRRRLCYDCGTRFTTVEVSKEYFDSVQDVKTIRNTLISELRKFMEMQDDTCAGKVTEDARP